jgi:hypothetical protein
MDLGRRSPDRPPDQGQGPWLHPDPRSEKLPASARQPAKTLSSSKKPEADLSKVRTIPVARRPNKVSAKEFAAPPVAGASFADFLESLPDVLVARDFLKVVDAVVNAARSKKTVIVMLGGHVVKTGLAPVMVDLMKRGIVTHIATNGSAAIHDYELARFGATSEDVAAGLRDGTFGMANETGGEMNAAFTAGMKDGIGMGEALGRALDEQKDLAGAEMSILLQSYRLGRPMTIHAALGAEIIHQHPATDGAAIGDTSHRDFRRLADIVTGLHDGGVVLNLGSAVIMPEVFLKALTIARNLGGGKPTGFVTADFDMTRHYRPRMNVVQRPTLESGKGYEITGHHELMIPLLAWAIVERLG